MGQKFEYKMCEGFELIPSDKSVEMGVFTFDRYYGGSNLTLDAVEVYKTLTEYFRGTEFE